MLQVPVSIRCENVTERETLEHVLTNSGLVLLKRATPGRFQITRALAPVPVRNVMSAAALPSTREVLESFSQFVMYSVGWNQHDDVAGATDWVWRHPDHARP